MTDTPAFTHVDVQGGVHMVDVGGKAGTLRTAVAAGRVVLGTEAFQLVSENKVRKGDVLTVAQIAGILGAKHTSDLIPMCHNVLLQKVDIELTLDEAATAVDIRAFTKAMGPTGVEMEALTAVSIAALTVYDMCKSISKEIRITDIHLRAKTGGVSGDYRSSEGR